MPLPVGDFLLGVGAIELILATELKVGELVKDDEFPLFDSVAALEVRCLRIGAC